MTALGVVMAGGRNVRFGGLKAFADVGGRRIVDRVIGALRDVTDDVVVIANDAAAYAPLGLPVRGDETGAGAALAGLLTAVHWSEARGRTGALVVACDMPFASPALLRALAAAAVDADVVVPESGGRRGVEPLCAFYANRCAPAIAAAIERNDLRMIGFHDAVRVVKLPAAEVTRIGDPAILFMNVNTPEDLEIARTIAAERGL